MSFSPLVLVSSIDKSSGDADFGGDAPAKKEGSIAALVLLTPGEIGWTLNSNRSPLFFLVFDPGLPGLMGWLENSRELTFGVDFLICFLVGVGSEWW